MISYFRFPLLFFLIIYHTSYYLFSLLLVFRNRLILFLLFNVLFVPLSAFRLVASSFICFFFLLSLLFLFLSWFFVFLLFPLLVVSFRPNPPPPPPLLPYSLTSWCKLSGKINVFDQSYGRIIIYYTLFTISWRRSPSPFYIFEENITCQYTSISSFPLTFHLKLSRINVRSKEICVMLSITHWL